jgi:hypothetical protein
MPNRIKPRHGAGEAGCGGAGEAARGLSAVFGTFGHAESRHPSAYPYYIYRYIYLLSSNHIT